MLRNNAKICRNVSAAIACGGAALLIAGILLDSMDTMWMILIGLIVSVTFFICVGVFAKQAGNLEDMFRGDGLIARFRFDPGEATHRISSEEKTRKKINRFLLSVIGACFAGFTILFVIFGFDSPEDAVFFVILMASVFGIILLAALTAPGAWKKRAGRSAGEVYIGVKGVWSFGEYLVWDAMLTRLAGIGFREDEVGFSEIVVTYQRMQRHGWQTSDYRIPVPRGQEEEGRRAAQEIARAHRLVLNQ